MQPPFCAITLPTLLSETTKAVTKTHFSLTNVLLKMSTSNFRTIKSLFRNISGVIERQSEIQMVSHKPWILNGPI